MRKSFLDRLPTEAEVGVCTGCGCRVLLFEAGAGEPAVVLWDPSARQRRWARGVISARDYATGPPWNWQFGGPHECPPPGDAPADAREALRRAADGWTPPRDRDRLFPGEGEVMP